MINGDYFIILTSITFIYLKIELLQAQEVESKLVEERVNVNRPSSPLVRLVMEE